MDDATLARWERVLARLNTAILLVQRDALSPSQRAALADDVRFVVEQAPQVIASARRAAGGRGTPS